MVWGVIPLVMMAAAQMAKQKQQQGQQNINDASSLIGGGNTPDFGMKPKMNIPMQSQRMLPQTQQPNMMPQQNSFSSALGRYGAFG